MPRQFRGNVSKPGFLLTLNCDIGRLKGFSETSEAR